MFKDFPQVSGLKFPVNVWQPSLRVTDYFVLLQVESMVDGYYEDVLAYIKDFSVRSRGHRPLLLAVMCHGDENQNMMFLEKSLPLQEIINSIYDADSSGVGTRVGFNPQSWMVRSIECLPYACT